MKDPWADPEWKAYAAHAIEELIPKVAESAITISLVPGSDLGAEVDIKYALELGVCILMDKPILAVAFPGEPVPPKLEKVADLLVRADLRTDEGQAELQRGIAQMMEKAATA